MRNKRPVLATLCAVALLGLGLAPHTARAELVDMPVVKLRSLDKATARTMIFEMRVGATVKFGPLFIKAQSCRKAPPIEQPESAAFLQIWEVTPQDESKWVYSGWMFASSPALSPMDHPIYDVWVLDCLERKSTDPVPAAKGKDAPGDGTTPPDGDTVTDAELSDDETILPPGETPPDSDRDGVIDSEDGDGIIIEGPVVTLPGEEE